MRRFATLIVLVFIPIVSAMAQEYVLKFEKVRNGEIKKTRIFEEGTILIVRTKDARYKGVFAIKDKQSIILDGGEIIKLSDIVKFRKPNGRLFGGITLTVLGGVTTWGGLLASSLEDIFDDDTNDNAENATVIGFLAMTSGIVLMTNYNHKPEKINWNLSIEEK